MKEPLCFKADGHFFFPKKRIPRKAAVLKKLGVKKGTFAGNMIARAYDYYFTGAIDFNKEYRKYYRLEFSSITGYIEERYNIEKSKAQQYADNHYCMKECSRYAIDRSVETLNYDQDFKTKFSEAVGGIKDEDSDGVYYE